MSDQRTVLRSTMERPWPVGGQANASPKKIDDQVARMHADADALAMVQRVLASHGIQLVGLISTTIGLEPGLDGDPALRIDIVVPRSLAMSNQKIKAPECQGGIDREPDTARQTKLFETSQGILRYFYDKSTSRSDATAVLNLALAIMCTYPADRTGQILKAGEHRPLIGGGLLNGQESDRDRSRHLSSE